MKKRILLYFVCLTLPILCFSQRGKKKGGNTISVTTTINYFPNELPYTFFSSFTYQLPPDLILDYSTNTSGTFTLIPSPLQSADRENQIEIPIPSLGLGASVQILTEDKLFHEISLTKFAFAKSSYRIDYIFVDSMERQVRQIRSGYEQKTAAFGLRYELGKYLNRRNNAKVKFGLSGAVEPSFYTYKRISLASNSFPITANVLNIDIAFIPMLNAKLSKNVSLDIKLITNMLLGESSNTSEGNPALTVEQQAGKSETDFPQFGIALNLGLRYTIKEAKKRRRR